MYWHYFSLVYYPIKRQLRKMVRHTQTMRRQQPTNCLSVFDHFVGLALKRLLCMILLFTCKCFIYDSHGKRTAQKMKFFIMDFFSKCEQIRRKLRIGSHPLKKSSMGKSSMENFIFCAVLTSEVYLESWQTSVMELFCETS